jgi:glucose 1-dehydrogenase
LGYLEGKVAVITGSASGIGRATVLKFVREGARVLAVDVNLEEGLKTVELAGIQGYKDMGLLERMKRGHMRKEILQPEQIANAVALLASDDADSINGSVVMVDDGFAEFK